MGLFCSKQTNVETHTMSSVQSGFERSGRQNSMKDFSQSVKKTFSFRKSTTYDNVHNTAVNRLPSDKTAGLKGLQNSGNTCFMNSSLQCLSNTIPLTDYFLGFDYTSEINVDNPLGTGGNLANSYAKLTKRIWSEKPSSSNNKHNNNSSSINPTWLRRDLSRYCSHLFATQAYGQTQEDAHEFLAYFLDGIHEDLNRVPSHNKPYIDSLDVSPDATMEAHAMIAWESYLKRNKSIIVDLFQGQLRNTMKCLKCKYEQIGFDPFMYLSLPIPKHSTPNDDTVSLDDCMQLFLSEEHLIGNNKWYCPKCKDHVEATKKFDIWMLPPILIIHLKRFQFLDNYHKKIDTRIDYRMTHWKLPLQAGSLNEYNDNRQNSLFYDLYAIAHHHGSGIGSGHYTAHCKNRFNDYWYHFNDSTCNHIPSPQSLESLPSAYCLFYNRSVPANLNQKIPKIYRQTLTRPDLWPHMQVGQSDTTTTDMIVEDQVTSISKSSREEFRSFARKSTASYEKVQ